MSTAVVLIISAMHLCIDPFTRREFYYWEVLEDGGPGRDPPHRKTAPPPPPPLLGSFLLLLCTSPLSHKGQPPFTTKETSTRVSASRRPFLYTQTPHPKQIHYSKTSPPRRMTPATKIYNIFTAQQDLTRLQLPARWWLYPQRNEINLALRCKRILATRPSSISHFFTTIALFT